jgi:hypothetical protein
MNPASSYYLAFNTGFPNAYDRSWGYTGSELMVHGDCSSRGCYAMTDEQIQEIYALARESFFGGQKAFQLQALPFRMTALNMAKHRNNPNFAFWKMLKEGYDNFEASKQEPKVAVCERRYVFDPAQPENASKPLKFDSKGKCPVYELDKSVADVVLDHRRQEQVKMAEYVAQGVATVPFRHGIDGGMNPVFAEKLGVQDGYDSKGRLIQVATAPGALPRSANAPAPATIVSVPKAAPETEAAVVVLANVPVPQPAPQPKRGEAPAEKPTSIAGLLGNVFGGTQAQSEGSLPAANEPVVLRGTKPETAKPRPVTRTANAAPAPKVSKTPEAIPPAPQLAAAGPSEPAKQRTASASKPNVASDASAGPAPQMRTAFSAPPASTGGLLTGAQPVVPVGSFDSRWSGVR